MKFDSLVEKELEEQLLQKRIQRLLQVRNQDKNNASSQCSQYREIINARKNQRYEESKGRKIAIKEGQLNGLKKNWQRSLISTGDAQKAANVEGKKSVLMEISNNQELIKNRSIASQRGKKALTIKHNEIQKNNLIKEQKLVNMAMLNDISSSHREDARAYAEYKYAQEEIAKNKSKPDYKYSIIKHQIGAHQSSPSIQNRVPVVVHALIQRHGLPETDTTTIFNTAEAEKDVVINKTFDRIVGELNARQVTQKRAIEARQACVKEQVLGDMMDTFEFLQKFDKQGGRTNRLKSGVMVTPDIEEPAVLQNFENEFLMQDEVIGDEEIIESNIDDEELNLRPDKSEDKGWLYQGDTTIVSNLDKSIPVITSTSNTPAVNPWTTIAKKNKADIHNKETDNQASNSNHYKISTPGAWNIPKSASNHFQKWEINDNDDYEASINQFNFNNNIANNDMKEYHITDKVNQILDPVAVIDNLLVVNSRSSSNSYFSDDDDDVDVDEDIDDVGVDDDVEDDEDIDGDHVDNEGNNGVRDEDNISGEHDEMDDELTEDNDDDKNNFNLNQFIQDQIGPNKYSKEELVQLNPLSNIYRPSLFLAEYENDNNEDNISINSQDKFSSSNHNNVVTNQGLLLDLQIDVDVSSSNYGTNEVGEVDKSWFNEVSNNEDTDGSIDISHSSTIDARHDLNNNSSSSVSHHDSEDNEHGNIEGYYPLNKSTEGQAEVIDAMLTLRETKRDDDNEEVDQEQVLSVSPHPQINSPLKSPTAQFLSSSIINSTVSLLSDNVSDISDNEDSNYDKQIENDESYNQSTDSILDYKSLEVSQSYMSNKSFVSSLHEGNSTKFNNKNSINKDENLNRSLNSSNIISLTESASSLSMLSSTINSDLIISPRVSSIEGNDRESKDNDISEENDIYEDSDINEDSDIDEENDLIEDGDINEDSDINEENGSNDALLTREMIHNEISNMRSRLISLNQGMTSNTTRQTIDADNYFEEGDSSEIFNLNNSISSRNINLKINSDDELDDDLDNDSVELVLNNVDLVNRKSQFSDLRNSSEELSLEYLLGPAPNNEEEEENNPILSIYNDDDEISTGSLSSSGFINSSLRLSDNSINYQNSSESVLDQLNKLKNSKEILKSHLKFSHENSNQLNKSNDILQKDINNEFNDSDELDLGEGLEMYRSLNSSIVSSAQSVKSNSSLNSSSSSGSNLVNMSLKSSQLYDTETNRTNTNSLSQSKITSSMMSKWDEQDESGVVSKTLNNNEISLNSSMSDDELNDMSLISSESLK
jgi:hypothetical protein